MPLFAGKYGMNNNFSSCKKLLDSLEEAVKLIETIRFENVLKTRETSNFARLLYG